VFSCHRLCGLPTFVFPSGVHIVTRSGVLFFFCFFFFRFSLHVVFSSVNLYTFLGLPEFFLFLKYYHCICSLITTVYGLDGPVSIPGRARNFSLLRKVQTASGAHPAPYPMGTGDNFPRG
jgi:hypothetical protein